MAVGRLIVITPPESAQAPPSEAPREPTAEYASLEAVRDTIAAIVRSAAGVADTAIHLRREPVQFKYHFAAGFGAGWAFHIVVNDTSACPNERVRDALSADGWIQDYDYTADGPDGEDMAFVTRRYLCVIEAQWDGGDDVDTTYVPRPGCQVTVTCVLRRADDVWGE